VDGELNPIDLDGDGVGDGSDEEILRELVYRSVPAVFRGLEEEARNHVSFLKDIAPLGARALQVGLRGTF